MRLAVAAAIALLVGVPAQPTSGLQPQPQGSECPFCYIDIAIGELYLELDPEQWRQALDAYELVELEVLTENGSDFYPLPARTRNDPSVLLMSFDPGLAPAGMTGANIHATLDDRTEWAPLTFIK